MPRAKHKELSQMQYAVMSLASFAIAILLLALYVLGAEHLARFGLQGNLFYVLLLPLGLSVASFTFGAMKSYARYKGQVVSGTLEAGGPIVAAALVVVGGLIGITPPPETFSITIRVEDAFAAPAANGELTLRYGNTSAKQPIAPNGEANFKDIPSIYRSASSRLVLSSPRYHLVEPSKEYPLSTSPWTVKVAEEDEFARRFRIGASARVIRTALLSYRNQNGRYPASLDELSQSEGVVTAVATIGPSRVSYQPSQDVGFLLRVSLNDDVLGNEDDRVQTEHY